MTGVSLYNQTTGVCLVQRAKSQGCRVENKAHLQK
jgi:hypothetical protein